MSKHTFRLPVVRLTLLFWIFIGLAVFPLEAAQPKEDDGETVKIPHDVPRIRSKIRVDGVLNDEAWKTALKLSPNYEVNPGENIPAPVKTEVFVTSSATHFYVGFYAYDPDPKSIRARFIDRDSIWNDDWVGIVLDTFSDHRHMYTFACNPYGIQAELVQSISGGNNLKWDAIWFSAGKLVKDGFVVEMAIPLSVLRIQRTKKVQVWGFDATRNYPRNLSHYIGLFPRDRNNNCYACQMEKIRGFKEIKPGKNIEITPTISVPYSEYRSPFLEGDFVKQDIQPEYGVTGRWGITPNMTLSATVNPDFSHVEADVAQMDINTQYTLNFPEKRPFFLEGSSIFQTRFNAVNTRVLSDPDWGLKLAGKEGRNDIGIFSVQDNITNILIPHTNYNDKMSLDMKSVGTVLRYRRDIGKVSTLGVLVTDREGEDYYNRVLGADGYLRFTANQEVRFQFLASQTRYPHQVVNADVGQSDEKITGTALDIFFKHSSRNIVYSMLYQQASPDFRADMGYMPQVGYRHVTSSIRFMMFRNPGHWFTRLMAIPTVRYETDFDNNLLFKAVILYLDYQGFLQSNISLQGQLSKQAYLGEIYDTNHISFNMDFRPSASFYFWFNAYYGDYIDFNNARQGRIFRVNPGIIYKLGRRLSMRLDHQIERLDIDAGRLYTVHLTNLNATYQFSRRAFLRTILQYNHRNHNVGNYTYEIVPEVKHLFSQVLFSYKLNPRTVLFLGYSDDSYGLQTYPLTRNSWSVFFKIGYAFRM